MNKLKVEEIRAAVKALKAASTRPRYSEEIKVAVREFLREGIGLREVANNTGIGHGTLCIWSRSVSKRKFRKIKVENPRAADVKLRVVLPSGIYVELSSVNLLKEILASII